jgi:nucleotide-binding universal stress UspA family protein
VLRSANHSVLVTDWRDLQKAGGAPSPVTHLVCGVDFSDGSLAAVREAARLSAALSASLTLVHARPAGSSGANVNDEARLAEVAREHAQGADVRVREGDTPQVLAAETDGRSGAVIVLGLRGAAKNRPGQTAIAVLASASVPVLGVPS